MRRIGLRRMTQHETVDLIRPSAVLTSDARNSTGRAFARDCRRCRPRSVRSGWFLLSKERLMRVPRQAEFSAAKMGKVRLSTRNHASSARAKLRKAERSQQLARLRHLALVAPETPCTLPRAVPQN